MIPSQLDFRRLKRIVTIEMVLADRGLLGHLRRRGAQLVGPCPIHRGDNLNAFVVHPARNIWRCFTGCDAGGDVVELARRLSGGSYRAAAAYLATLVSAPTPGFPDSNYPTPRPRPRPFQPFTRWLSLDPTASFLEQKGIWPQTARRYQVGAFYGPGMLADCVAVRLFDPKGKPLGYAGRRLDAEQARKYGKWKLPWRLPRNTLLYGYHQAARLLDCGVVLVEGPWGVLRLAQLGIPAVALLGSHLSTAQQVLLHDLPRVVVLMDGDKAGRKAAKAISQRLGSTTTVVVHLPDGLDPDDLSDYELAKIREYILL